MTNALSPKLFNLRIGFYSFWYLVQTPNGKKLCTNGGNNHGFGSLLKSRFCTYIAFQLILHTNTIKFLKKTYYIMQTHNDAPLDHTQFAVT